MIYDFPISSYAMQTGKLQAGGEERDGREPSACSPCQPAQRYRVTATTSWVTPRGPSQALSRVRALCRDEPTAPPALLESHGRLTISHGTSANSTTGLALKGQGRGREYKRGIFHSANSDSDGQGSKTGQQRLKNQNCSAPCRATQGKGVETLKS